MKFLSPDRLRFGIFSAPYHKPTLNPTVMFEQDLELIEHLDRLGYDEAWIGEHHSGGVEVIPAPELMVMAAVERTRSIKVGTGVATLPLHHPFMVAERIVQLDHMTRGRMMFGVGPGQMVRDAEMIGRSLNDSRPRLQESLDAILRLLRGESVTEKTDWYELNDAELQILPYSDFDVAVVSVLSPSGPQVAGRFGTGLLSVAATDPAGIERLANHWSIVEDQAAKYGQSVSRSDWRMVGKIHLADSYEQAREDLKHGLQWFLDYGVRVNPSPVRDFSDFDAVVDRMIASGSFVIGTAKDAISQIERLIEKSNGGFGTFLIQDGDWATLPARKRSFELFAEEVIPYFNGSGTSLRKSNQKLLDTGWDAADATAAAQASFTEAFNANH